MTPSDYQTFANQKLQLNFNDINLLVTAFTHRSYTNEHRRQNIEHNERLEFLGDAILELVASDFLFRNYKQPEGTMTAWRSALVRTESIGQVAAELGFHDYLRLGKGEKHGSDRAHAVILADCCEAVIGAIYLDHGYSAAENFIKKHILSRIDQILEEGTWRDPKSYFQELAQRREGHTPSYRVIKEQGPDHEKTFTVGVYVGRELRGIGDGHSKQEAQTSAATAGIKFYKQKATSGKSKSKQQIGFVGDQH